MSLYNLIHGTNPLAGVLLSMLDLTPADVGRFRDCYLASEGDTTEIHVYTRNGGDNREWYQGVFDELADHPEYVENWDDDFDCTYATIAFRVPEKFRDAVERLIAEHPEAVPPSPQERFQAFLDKLQSGSADPDVQRVTKAVEPLVKAIAEKTR